MTPPEEQLVSLRDYERAATHAMTASARAYIDGGAGNETTLADNLAAWDRIALAPRMLTGVAAPDPAVTLLGRRHPHPVIVAPTAFAAHAHPDAEPGIARAAQATDTTLCLSTLASTPTADLAAAVPGVDRWQQLYVFTDRGVTREIVTAAEAHGYSALVVTADRPVLGTRERELRAQVRGVDPADGTLARRAPADFSAHIDETLDWSDIATFAAQTELPVIVKGILTPRDAQLAAEHGAAGVVVSNHGGRQLDTVLSGADALPAIAEAAGDRLDVIVDGGIRRGTDIVKALALGADAVMVGRPLLHGLAVDGSAGARRVLEILLRELSVALALTGAPSAEALDPSYLTPAPWARA